LIHQNQKYVLSLLPKETGKEAKANQRYSMSPKKGGWKEE
jgi:hypothetical protein